MLAPPAPCFAAPDAGGNGAASRADADRYRAQHERKVHALTSGETGVSFESLVLFAEPVFSHYGLDPAEAFALDPADEATVAVLETARLLWAYFALDPEERAPLRPRLAEHLLGPHRDVEDEADFDALLDAAEEQWAMLTPEERELAATDHASLDLPALLEHDAFAVAHADSNTATYGPDRLGELEAQALFAQPLFAEVSDPDELEAAMERANEYWTLAHLHGPEREQYLDAYVEAVALDRDEAAALRAEAERMTRRFYELFPERAPS
ncbi:MAG: hypothetical protein R3362_04310 [Rhodothermales bacterium]|nr:hypothetical protein [Rhodothermales bacterium]